MSRIHTQHNIHMQMQYFVSSHRANTKQDEWHTVFTDTSHHQERESEQPPKNLFILCIPFSVYLPFISAFTHMVLSPNNELHHPLLGFLPSLTQPFVIWLDALIYSHSCSCSAFTFPPSFKLIPACCLHSYAKFTTVLFLLNVPSIISSSLQQMMGKVPSCRDLSGTFQSCRAEWQSVGTICDTQSCKQLITSYLALYLTQHGRMESEVCFSRQWHQAELWRRVHTQTHSFLAHLCEDIHWHKASS